jgi:CubicO group peptidase (beta-lactamase class C family)
MLHFAKSLKQRSPSMKRFRPFAVALALLLSAIPALTQNRPALSAAGAAEIDGILQRAVAQGAVPGVVVMVAGKDGILYQNAFGLMDVGKQKPMTKDAIFRIASMTKPVTSVAVMMLVEQGKLRLDDPASNYIPSFKDREVIATFNPADASFTTKKAVHEVLIRHLLTNTSGVAYTFANDTANRLQQKLGKPAEELPLLYEPGTRWTYSGSTRVLGQIVEKVTGTSLDKFFQEKIFGPLEMQDISYTVPAAKMNRVVTAHRRESGKLVETPNGDKLQSAVAGDGGLNSPAADYIKFLQMFLNDGKAGGATLLRKDSIQLMTKNEIGDVIVQTQQTTNPALSQSFPIGAGRDKFGFGFQITTSNKENPNLRSPGSYTWAGINNTHFWVDQKRQIAAVIMMQVLPFYDDACMKVYQDVEAALGKNLK